VTREDEVDPRQALRDPTMSIAEIATTVGYANEASFGRAFRRTFAGAAIGSLGDDRLRRGVDQAVEQGAVA
jgi:methylphosphotriester-DNA--protein-cysteine methyltransferase